MHMKLGPAIKIFAAVKGLLAMRTEHADILQALRSSRNPYSREWTVLIFFKGFYSFFFKVFFI